MKRFSPLLALLCGMALCGQGPALADAVRVYPGPGTLLRLSESAEVTRVPDEVRATLRYEAREASPAAAQAAVNRAMAAALETARAAPGVAASTGAYGTYRQEDPPRWVASQALNLRAADQAALLDLLGTLQSRGLALAGLDHGLTREARRTARQEAAAMALDALRRRAEALAGGIGMRVERIAEIELDAGDAPSPRPMMAAMARGAPAPVAQAEDVVVTASAQAVVVLVPR